MHICVGEIKPQNLNFPVTTKMPRCELQVHINSSQGLASLSMHYVKKKAAFSHILFV